MCIQVRPVVPFVSSHVPLTQYKFEVGDALSHKLEVGERHSCASWHLSHTWHCRSLTCCFCVQLLKPATTCQGAKTLTLYYRQVQQTSRLQTAALGPTYPLHVRTLTYLLAYRLIQLHRQSFYRRVFIECINAITISFIEVLMVRSYNLQIKIVRMTHVVKF